MMQTHLRDVTQDCKIRIDKDGRWYYECKEIINPHVLKAFCEALECDSEGRYKIVIGQELCYIEIEDTPFVVASIHGDTETGLILLLNTAETFPFDPSNLWIGKDNAFYTMLPNGMKVRFLRAAYYALALMMEEDSKGDIILKVRDKTYTIVTNQG